MIIKCVHFVGMQLPFPRESWKGNVYYKPSLKASSIFVLGYMAPKSCLETASLVKFFSKEFESMPHQLHLLDILLGSQTAGLDAVVLFKLSSRAGSPAHRQK